MYDVLVVDGPYVAHRSFSAPYELITSTGLNSTMIHGFMQSLKACKTKTIPNKIVIAWESHMTPSWRRKLRPEYKSNRVRTPQQYISQLADLQTILYHLGIAQYNSPTNEADDVIAHITKESPSAIIFTKDKDMFQLISDTVHVFDGTSIITKTSVENKFGVPPSLLVDFLAIVGDKSDTIEGIDGYGQKKTAKLLMEHNGVPENFFSKKQQQQIQQNKILITLNDSCHLFSLPEPKPTKRIQDVISLLDKYELRKIKENLEEYKTNN